MFIDVREGEGAYRLADRYRIEGNAVEVTVNVFRWTEARRADLGAGH